MLNTALKFKLTSDKRIIVSLHLNAIVINQTTLILVYSKEIVRVKMAFYQELIGSKKIPSIGLGTWKVSFLFTTVFKIIIFVKVLINHFLIFKLII